MVVLGVLGAALLGAAGVVLRRRRLRDEELGLGPDAVRTRTAGVGYLGQAPVYPHHRLGRR